MTSLNWLKNDAQGSSFWSNTSSNIYSSRDGCGLLVSSDCAIHSLDDITSNFITQANANRYLLVQGFLEETKIYIHCIYAPTGDTPEKREFFNSLPRDFEPTAQHIVCGDFNLVLDPFLDKAVASHRRPVGALELQSWMAALGLIDSWRAFNPDDRVYSNPTHSNRIDFALFSGELHASNVKQIRYMTDKYNVYFHNDHAPIKFDLAASAFSPPKKAPWRCPPWIFKLPEVKSHLEFTLECTLAQLLPAEAVGFNPAKILDDHLFHDKAYLQSLVTLHHEADSKTCDQIRLQIASLSSQLAATPSEDIMAALTEAQQHLKDTLHDIKVRNEQTLFEEQMRTQDQCTQLFFRPPVPRRYNVAFPVTNAEEWTSKTQYCREYWAKIFHSPTPNTRAADQEYNLDHHREILQHCKARLTQDQVEALEAPLTAEEFTSAIKASPNGRAPGPDGLPFEYFKVCPELWGHLLEIVHDFNFSRKFMTNSQRRASLSLLHKGGAVDRMPNYRPLTLLNASAKFAPAILAKRTNQVLPSLLGPQQYGFTPNRSIFQAIQEFHGLQHFCQTTNKTRAGAIMCDFFKAFDSVARAVLLQTLQHFGFGPNYCTWMETIFADTEVSILFNNSPLEPFVLGSGVRQGDPISPALFVLFIEPLLELIRTKLGHLSITSTFGSHLEVAFADDLTGFLNNLEDSHLFLDIVQDFCSATGMRLNMAKTLIMPFHSNYPDSLKTAITALQGPKFIERGQSCRWLGIQEGPSITDADRYQSLVQKVTTRCNLWKFRARTLHGRILILRSIILPLLWFTASVCHLPEAILKEVETVAVAFVYGKLHRNGMVANHLSRQWLYLPRNKGGLGLVPLQVCVKVLQLRALINLVKAIAEAQDIPSWCAPALALFHSVAYPRGHGLDILFDHFPHHSSASPHLSKLGRFWFYTLQAWQNSMLPRLQHPSDSLSKLIAPVWIDRSFAVLLTTPTLGGTKRTVHHYITHGLLTLGDFYSHFDQAPSQELLTNFLKSQRTASAQASASALYTNLEPHFPSTWIYPPVSPRAIHGSLFQWAFNVPSRGVKDLDALSNRHLRLCIKHSQASPKVPWERLEVQQAPADNFWSVELRRDSVLLPIFADFKFRLQHNALAFGYKYIKWKQQLTHPTTCAFGCLHIENARHIFWTCPLVVDIWSDFLIPFAGLLDGPFTWEAILLGEINLSAEAPIQARPIFQTVFHIIRSVVLRMVWLHRNDKVYGHITSNDFTRPKQLSRHYIKAHILSHFGSFSSLGPLGEILQPILASETLI